MRLVSPRPTSTHRLALALSLSSGALGLLACGSANSTPPAPASAASSVAATPESTAATTPDATPKRAPVGTVPLGAPCGGARGLCDADGYCRFPDEAACGDGDVAGVCTARPTGCARTCPRVCACDGADLCNTCVARARGFSVRHKGRCGAPAASAEVTDEAP